MAKNKITITITRELWKHIHLNKQMGESNDQTLKRLLSIKETTRDE